MGCITVNVQHLLQTTKLLYSSLHFVNKLWFYPLFVAGVTDLPAVDIVDVLLCKTSSLHRSIAVTDIASNIADMVYGSR